MRICDAHDLPRFMPYPFSGVVEFEATDSAKDKIEYIYRLLVHDKVIQGLPEDQVSLKSMQHKLAIWASKR